MDDETTDERLRALGGSPAGTMDAGELLAALHTVRRRLQRRSDVHELHAWLDRLLDDPDPAAKPIVDRLLSAGLTRSQVADWWVTRSEWLDGRTPEWALHDGDLGGVDRAVTRMFPEGDDDA